MDWPPLPHLQKIALAETRRLLASLPEDLREASERIPIHLGALPGPDLDPDLLGLFEGPTLAEQEGGAFPETPQITLFLDNLWDYTDGVEADFREEIRLTVLHELGHFWGWDEDDLERRGLD
jgi:predicted Zn-dependent protease with MMP-like domain